MRSKMRLCAILPLLAVVLAGCGSDVSGPDPDPDPDPDPLPVSDTLPVLGHGTIDARYTAEVAVRDDWAYTSTWGNRGAPGNAVFIWDVSAAQPVLVDSLIIAGASTTGDVQISDDGVLLVVATEFSPGSIVIYDRSTPALPVHVATFTSPSTDRGVHTVKLGRVNGRHYAFLSIDPGAEPARLVIADITNPTNPSQVLDRAMGSPFVHDVFVRDGLLFTALWHDGVTIWDIGGGGRGGTPADPVLIVNYLPVSGSIHNVWWFHDPASQQKRYLFLGEEGPGSVGSRTASGDIHVIDVSNLSQPEQVAIYSIPGAGTHNFWMDEESGVLYAAYYNAGVRAIDVRGDLGSCTSAQRSPKGPCDLRRMNREAGVSLLGTTFIWGVVHQGTHLYASDMLSGIYKVDASALVR
ncbi:MAG TPA: hypothetical protein VK933_16250 [Longimicrobiales bacterium]|nr:hypothetical protein [Longimicrobiales bacterium]